jgi:CelD/BcsL family acetyltransferase involved in cellulose biosynthesis
MAAIAQGQIAQGQGAHGQVGSGHGEWGVREGVAARSAGARDVLSAEILPGLAEAEPLWRALEASPDSLATPYQRFDWSCAFLQETGEAAAARVAVLRDRGGRVRALVPLVIRRQGGLSVARSVGDAHANFHMPVFAARDVAAVPADEIRAAMIAAGRQAGIDVFVFSHQPRIWEGFPNPFAFRGEQERSSAYGLVLGPDPDSTAKRIFSPDSRKKLRSKEKRLTEALGPLEYRMAADAAEAQDILATFYTQKSARFAGMGVGDPYAVEGIRRFLHRASAGDGPAVEVHALRVAATGRVLAVFGGAVNDTRYSGMMTSFDGDPEIGRYSPGDLLLYHLVREQTARGRLGFDLGVGEARYKANICDETITLVETLWPVTAGGHLFTLLRVANLRMKRRVRNDPRLFGAACKIRKLLRRASGGGPARSSLPAGAPAPRG